MYSKKLLKVAKYIPTAVSFPRSILQLLIIIKVLNYLIKKSKDVYVYSELVIKRNN